MRRILSVLLFLNSVALADPFWLHQTPGNPALSLTVLPGTTQDAQPELVAGYDSGAITCFSMGSSGGPRAVWTSMLDGSILALQTIADINADGFPEVIAATDLGLVACVSARGPSAGKTHWSVSATFNISELAVLEDTNGDGVDEVAFGGADHRVHLLSGANGKQLWSRFLDARGGLTYVDCLADAGDLNGDRISDLFVRTWDANRWAISGVDGADIWSPRRGDRFLSTLVTSRDMNGDGVQECLESGNDGILILCNGKDGEEIWRSELGRPIRAIAVSKDAPSDGSFDCFAGTAEGKIACVAGKTSETVGVRWTAAVGDVCRKLVILGDIDKDGTSDVVAGAENGVVAAFSGANGKRLWQWRGADVVRTLVGFPDVDADGIPDIAVALLDGTLTLLPGRPQTDESAAPPSKTATSKPARKTPEPRRASPSAQDVTEVPILLYHDIPPKGLHPADSDPLANFREQMDLLVEGGYTAVSLDEIAEWIEGKRKLPPKPVCITFDGQYAAHDTHVFNILRDRGLFAISYITTDWIGTANHLDWHELRRLEESGVMQIENHSFNHPTLTTVSQEEVRRQVTVSNTAISRHLDGKVSRHHAYPNGVQNSTVCDIVRESGFRTATIVQHRKANRSDNLFRLPRYTIAENMSLSTFKPVIGYKPLPYPALGYEFRGTVGSGWRQPSYGDVDAEGKLWVCDYSANHVRIFLPDGSEAPFSPITQGLNQKGESMPVRAPSGVAAAPNGEILITIADRFGSVRHFGLFRYRASDGVALSGIDLPYGPGDVDTDANGLIYVVGKLTGQWHVYTPMGAEVPGSPFGQDAGINISRGIAVTPDASRVYVLGQMSADVQVWTGIATHTSARYDRAGTLTEKLSSQCGGVDVMEDGTVLVGYHDEGMVVAFDAQHQLLGQISGGSSPSLSGPRGVAFQPDGKTLWIISRFGQVQRWEKRPGS